MKIMDNALAGSKHDILRTVIKLYDDSGDLKPTLVTFPNFTELALAVRPNLYKPLVGGKKKKENMKRKITGFFSPVQKRYRK